MAAASWALLIAVVLLTAPLAGWVLLAAALLGRGQLPVALLLALLLAVTAGLAWLVARYVATPRSVGLAIGLIFQQNLSPQGFQTIRTSIDCKMEQAHRDWDIDYPSCLEFLIAQCP